MRVAMVGCGYAADYYVKAIARHPTLTLTGVFDRNPARQSEFVVYHGVRGYSSLEMLLEDPEVQLVVNVTSPESHVAVSEAALLAGKHVYSEKPLALTLAQAQYLRGLAERMGLLLVSAPCNLLGEAVQTVWQSLRAGRIGTPRAVYVELEAGPIMQMSPEKWRSASGAPFPLSDEVSLGWTVAHAGYGLSLLTAVFGPAELLVSYSANLSPAQKHVRPRPWTRAADFSVACLTFGGGVVARLTSGMMGARDQSVRIVGDEGSITLHHSGAFSSPVTLTLGADPEPVPVPLLGRRSSNGRDPSCNDYDFALGIVDLAQAARAEDVLHLPIDHAVHVLELTLAIAESTTGEILKPDTSFSAVPPARWASHA